MGITQYPFPKNIRYGTSKVATSQTTTSGSYVALTTAQEVSIFTGTRALVILTATMSNNTANGDAYMSFTVSGATTISASDSISVGTNNAAQQIRMSGATIVTLTPGNNTFAARFRGEAATTATFSDREITVIPLD